MTTAPGGKARVLLAYAKPDFAFYCRSSLFTLSSALVLLYNLVLKIALILWLNVFVGESGSSIMGFAPWRMLRARVSIWVLGFAVNFDKTYIKALAISFRMMRTRGLHNVWLNPPHCIAALALIKRNMFDGDCFGIINNRLMMTCDHACRPVRPKSTH